MKYLLYSGAPNTGKNAMIRLTCTYLIEELGYDVDDRFVPEPMSIDWHFNENHPRNRDFYVLLKKGNKYPT